MTDEATSEERPDTAWSIRSGGPHDARGLLDLWRAAGAEQTLTDDVSSIVRLCNHDPGALIVADSEHEIVGSVIAGFDGWRGHVYRLAVHPRLRRHGLAGALVAEAERRLSSYGARRVNALVVGEEAHAVAFWEAAGYPRDPRISRHVRTLGIPPGHE